MDEVREHAVEMYTDGLCSAACMFASDVDPCDCRCDGLWHGLMYANAVPIYDEHRLDVSMIASHMSEYGVLALRGIIGAHPGSMPIYLHLRESDDTKVLRLKESVDGCDLFHEQIERWMSRQIRVHEKENA